MEGVIYDRDLSVSARLFGLFLHPFSYLFSAIVRTRVFSVRKKLVLSSMPALDCFVLVVGNLTVGGNGENPGGGEVCEGTGLPGAKSCHLESWVQEQAGFGGQLFW